MDEVTIIRLDLAKRIFQLHGARQDGGVGFRRKLPRGQLLTFLMKLPRCIVAMEACATAHYWAREIAAVDTTFGWCRQPMSNPLSNGRKMMQLMQRPLRKRRAGPQCGSSNPRRNISRRER